MRCRMTLTDTTLAGQPAAPSSRGRGIHPLNLENAMPSITAAIKQAASQVTLYKQGRDWVVSTWDEQANAWRQHNPTDFWSASEHARRCKVQTALELLGVPADEADYLASTREGSAAAAVCAVMRERARQAASR